MLLFSFFDILPAPPTALFGESFGSVKGGNVAFVLVVIGAMLRGADNPGSSFASSSEDTSGLFLCGVGPGTNLDYLRPISGIGFMLTTTVATAGPGSMEFPFALARLGMMYVV